MNETPKTITLTPEALHSLLRAAGQNAKRKFLAGDKRDFGATQPGFAEALWEEVSRG